MAIRIVYHGSYRVPRRRLKTGGFDLKQIKKEMEVKVSSRVKKCSGVYVFLRQTRGLEARYVGVNTTGNLLGEAMSKSDIISNHLLADYGTTRVLFLECKKPKAMPKTSFKEKLGLLEDYLIVDLTLKGHDLVNKRKKPRNSKFDFAFNAKSTSAMTFKKLVNRKGIPHI